VHARALTGLDATKARVVAVLPQAALVHFGTHGRAFGSEAEARSSFVVLAPDTADDGLLTVAEVADSLRLSAELVVLLACQTGLGDIKETEGTIGLQRAFLARGARSVLVSLWQVDTAATDVLIREFYEQWLDRRTGKAEALRLAQMKVSKEWTIGRSPGRRLNPYWWAGFQLVGAH
jgi:CHAT domain-containing protein